MSERTKQAQLLTIGSLARAAGVPAETLRTWERRYGFPTAERTSSGHRRYSLATLERLRLVLAAVQLGHRPSVALLASEPELQGLLTHGRPLLANAEGQAGRERVESDASALARFIELIKQFDGRSLDRELQTALHALGAARFLRLRAGPLLHEIGERWSHSEVGVRHEHFATERIAEFFQRSWQPLSDAASGPIAVCATPAGERHALGLHMAALTLALANLRVVFLGPDLPAIEIAEAVTQHAGRAVVLSAAAGVEKQRAHAECRALRATLGPDLPIVVGGRGFEDPPGDVTRLDSFDALAEWARQFARGFSPN